MLGLLEFRVLGEDLRFGFLEDAIEARGTVSGKMTLP
jgi:hypothetical protein